MTRWDNGGFWPIDGDTRRDPGGFQLVTLSSGTMVVGKGEGRAGLSSAASPRTGARRGGGFRPGLDTLAERGQAWRRPGVAQGVVKDRRRESQQGACGGESIARDPVACRGKGQKKAAQGHGMVGSACDVTSRVGGRVGIRDAAGVRGGDCCKVKKTGPARAGRVVRPDSGTSLCCRRAQCHSPPSRRNLGGKKGPRR